MNIRPDELWKTIIEDFFEPCIYFFYPTDADEVDWSQPPEFLDKELAKLFPRSKNKGRVADKLAKVWLKNGESRWILIHIEVQGYPDPDFPKRMYQMRVRVREKYGVEVVAIAVLTDDDEHYLPDGYYERIWDNEVTYKWHTFKLLHHPPDTLADRRNIFSIVMEIAYHRLRKGKLKDPDLLEFKIAMVRRLVREKLPPEKIRSLWAFVDEYVRFARSDFQDTFEAKFDEILKIEKGMTTFELVKTTRDKYYKRLMKRVEKRSLEKGMEMAVRLLLLAGHAPEKIATDLKIDLQRVLNIQQDTATQN